MFDWNDEELDNIIWGEPGEIDDHIVPYREGSEDKPPGLQGDHIKKEQDHDATNAKPAGQKKPAKIEYTRGEQASPLHYDTNEGISASGYNMDPLPDLSSKHLVRIHQGSMGTEVSNVLTEAAEFGSSKGGETTQLDNCSDIIQNQHETREQSDFVDYGWDNIGSFDDLDRIFSNDDSVFGNVSLGNANELWPSSKDIANSPEGSFQLSMDSPSLGLGTQRSTSGHFEVKTEYVQDQDHSSTHGYARMNYLASYSQQNVHAGGDQVDYVGGKSKHVSKEKSDIELLGKTPEFNSNLAAENIATLNEFRDKAQGKNQRKISRSHKKSGGSVGQESQDSCATWSLSSNQFLQLDDQIALSMPQITSSVLYEQIQLQRPASSQYQQSTTPLAASSVNGSIKNQCCTVNNFPQIHAGEDNQAALSGYEVSSSITNPLSRSLGASTKSLIMTPQEKIEKLRWRQQMQALLAIQKQQQQLNHQVTCNDLSVAQKFLHAYQVQKMQGGDIAVENNSTLPSNDPNSNIEQDDSDAISLAIENNYSVEDTVLHQLQDIVTKLDIRIRLCIRDSLFRLAQSAMQRHYANETSSTNKDSRNELEILTTEEASHHNRLTQMSNVETATNPIDRTVAHLLFHRSIKLSTKHPDTPESPASAKFPCERKTAGSLNSPRGTLPDNYKSKQDMSICASRDPIPGLHAKGDCSKNNPCMDTSENASNAEAAAAAADDRGTGVN